MTSKSVFFEDLLLDCDESCLNSTGDTSILSPTCYPTSSLPQSVPHSTSCSYALPRLRRHPSLFSQATVAQVTDHPQRRRGPTHPLNRIRSQNLSSFAVTGWFRETNSAAATPAPARYLPRDRNESRVKVDNLNSRF
ncbi:hypothetical protein GALMADRAFT_1208371 [Galerina marginata CBS 339.88]|uniref:Uncharacterized protein n=1 Tax=Galerina marginata (strain CBS 339.88) TaxID=685588 RepID=A0A067SEB7_GALM3|nr:hypothetical protein GALMADRAFT_1208371 [Galerina marginata CBS 339.88]